MARREAGGPSVEKETRSQVGRLLTNLALAFALLGLLVAWGAQGLYQLEPGQEAVILRFGRYARTVTEPGPKLHLPPPIESHAVVNVSAVEREEFGSREAGAEGREERLTWASAMQTSDNNIVHLDFEVQFRVKDAFFSLYRVADRRETLRDAAQAAMREVVGRTSIDGVLSEQRGEVESEARDLLQGILDRYESGLLIQEVNLQEVQPPAAVRDAFDDVLAASQDRSRTMNEAEGYANEVLPRARAESIEQLESARAYRDARIAEATGESARFRALVTEYQKAREVTRRRLYLETMEQILPEVEKVIVDPGTNVLPHLPLGLDREAPRP